MAKLFLSYARDDVSQVGPLAAALAAEGHEVWWDRHITGGQEFAHAIEQALESAEVVVACWTQASIHSDWVRDEAAVGRDRGCLVPISLDGARPPLGFRQYHTIDIAGWDGRPDSPALEPLKQAIAQREGKPCQPRPQTESPAPRIRAARPRRRLAAVAVAGLLALSAGGVWLSGFGRSAGFDPTVAVGQFALTSASLPREVPALLGQEIVAAFGAENAVTVIAPSERSAAAGAPFVVEGSISQLGSRVRFTINLRNQKSGVVLWSHAFEQESADPIATRQVAVGASQVVRCGLWGTSTYPGRMSDQALSLYFKWCNEHWSGSTSETAELDAARRVTVAVPDFSFGWSALALAAVPLVAAKSDEAGPLRRQAEAAAHRSMELDEQNPEGYMALAGLLPLHRYAEREALLKKALGVRPTECGCERQAYGDFLASVGRMEEAVEQYERARDMRPLAPFSNLRFAQALYLVGRNEEADQVLSTTLQLWPEATSLRLLRIKSALWTRRYDEAIDQLDDPDLPLTSRQREVLVRAFAALKTAAPADRAGSIKELENFARDPRYNDKLVVGLLAALGARESAIAAAAGLVRTRGLFDAEVLFEPNLAAARLEPRYAELLRAIGLVDYWRSVSRLPDICRDGGQLQYCSVA